MPGLALPAAAARPLRLEGDALANAGRVHGVANGDDGAADLVAEHQRAVHDHRPDPAVLVVVHVRPAHSDRADPDQRLVSAGLRDRPFPQFDGLRPGQHRRPHRDVHVVSSTVRRVRVHVSDSRHVAVMP